MNCENKQPNTVKKFIMFRVWRDAVFSLSLCIHTHTLLYKKLVFTCVHLTKYRKMCFKRNGGGNRKRNKVVNKMSRFIFYNKF